MSAPRVLVRSLAAVMALSLALHAGPALSQGYPPYGKPIPPREPFPRGSRPSGHESGRVRPREPWMRKSVLVGAYMPNAFNPDNLSKWFGPRPGPALALVNPISPVLDLRLLVDASELTLRRAKFERELGTIRSSTTVTSVASGSVGLWVHPASEGLRPFVGVAVMLPDISQPAISYTDARGQGQTLEGTEIFALDPGYNVGAGLEWRRPGALGGELDVRWWVAPGRTREAVVLVPLRVSLSIPLPEGW